MINHRCLFDGFTGFHFVGWKKVFLCFPFCDCFFFVVVVVVDSSPAGTRFDCVLTVLEKLVCFTP